MDNKVKHIFNLGFLYEKSHTLFRLWAPSADEVFLRLYEQGDGDCLRMEVPMEKTSEGVWTADAEGDQNHTYYTFRVVRGEDSVETQDPYAVAAGVNGIRSMVVDLAETDPCGFAGDQGPALVSPTDAIVCEISVKDMTEDEGAGIAHPGKFLGLAEKGTHRADGLPTGLSYLKELGITHVQLMPIFDFASIDEAGDSDQYNWGYDPLNYNVPEGSYSTDPFHGEVRIRELKEMIMALHQAGIGVIMDVVYNHVYSAVDSCFEKTEPGYFFRKNRGEYSNGSGCGNEVASEQPMVRKYIVDSFCYWAREYHIDGFRMDLMGVLDIETLNEVSQKLKEIKPDILLYGEGWTGGESVYSSTRRAMKTNVRMLDGIGMFSDDIRDNIRGDVFISKERGFVAGRPGLENAIRYCVAGAVWHPQVDYGGYYYTQGGPWAEDPKDVVNYVSCHDNLTLWDKLRVASPEKSDEERYEMNRLAAAMVFTAQGTPFFLSGEECARTKPVAGSDEVSENSYNLPLFTNVFHYERTEEKEQLLNYYKGLIAFRKAHEGLRLTTAKDVRTKIHFMEFLPEKVVAFTIETGDERLFVAYNASNTDVTLELGEGENWQVFVDKNHAGITPLREAKNTVVVEGTSCLTATASVC